MGVTAWKPEQKLVRHASRRRSGNFWSVEVIVLVDRFEEKGESE